MLKIYRSESQLSIRTGSGRRVLFEDLSGGGSYLQTDNLDLQHELESHPMFGIAFNWDSATRRRVEEEANKSEEAEIFPVVNDDPSEEVPVDNSTEEEAKEVNVSGIADAKDYLAENYGVLRTQMRSKAQIKEIAEQYNIVFVGL